MSLPQLAVAQVDGPSLSPFLRKCLTVLPQLIALSSGLIPLISVFSTIARCQGKHWTGHWTVLPLLPLWSISISFEIRNFDLSIFDLVLENDRDVYFPSTLIEASFNAVYILLVSCSVFTTSLTSRSQIE